MFVYSSYSNSCANSPAISISNGRTFTYPNSGTCNDFYHFANNGKLFYAATVRQS